MRDRADEGTDRPEDAAGRAGGSDAGPPPPSPQVLSVSGALDAPGGAGSSRPDAVLVLTSPTGATYHLPIDGTLRAALRQATASASGTTGTLDAVPAALRPKDIQRRIRAGESVAELAESSGASTEQIERYAGPVLAERAHIAAVASATVVREQRSRPVLADLVRHRLSSRGVALSSVSWDAWRRGEQGWALQVSFRAGTRDRLAQWAYDPTGESVEPLDDEARWLSASHEADGPGRRLSAVRVFDVETDGGIRESPGLGGETAPSGSSGPSAPPGTTTGSITGMNTGPGSGAAPDLTPPGLDAGPVGPWTAPDHDEVAARTMDLLDALSDRRGRRQPVPDLDGEGWDEEDGEDDDLVDVLLDLPPGARTRPGGGDARDLPAFGEPPAQPPAAESHLRAVPAPAWDGPGAGEPAVEPWQGPGSSGHPSDEDGPGADSAGGAGGADGAGGPGAGSGAQEQPAGDRRGGGARRGGSSRSAAIGLVPPLPPTGQVEAVPAPAAPAAPVPPATPPAPPRAGRDDARAEVGDTVETPPAVPAPAEEQVAPTRSRAPRRPSVPSWDEIVFGSPRPDAD